MWTTRCERGYNVSILSSLSAREETRPHATSSTSGPLAYQCRPNHRSVCTKAAGNTRSCSTGALALLRKLLILADSFRLGSARAVTGPHQSSLVSVLSGALIERDYAGLPAQCALYRARLIGPSTAGERCPDIHSRALRRRRTVAAPARRVSYTEAARICCFHFGCVAERHTRTSLDAGPREIELKFAASDLEVCASSRRRDPLPPTHLH